VLVLLLQDTDRCSARAAACSYSFSTWLPRLQALAACTAAAAIQLLLWPHNCQSWQTTEMSPLTAVAAAALLDERHCNAAER
jgi:hypothetical protein